VKQESDFSTDFAGENGCPDGQFHGRDVTDEHNNLKLDRILRPSYSADLIPFDFWLFGMLKKKHQGSSV
jgi:hypothetical protein